MVYRRRSRSKSRRRSRKRSRRRSVRRTSVKKPCKSGQRRSIKTGRCAEYVRVINKSKSKADCKRRLSDKIRINMEELEAGRFSSRNQAVAVSYSQVNKKYPSCKKYFSRY
jgi:hypothetical protein